MGSYELLFAKSADRDFRSLPQNELPRVMERVLHLEEDPRPAQSRNRLSKLLQPDNLRGGRSGDWWEDDKGP
jgi:hypothetical protein